MEKQTAHLESSRKVYFTMDYGRFKFLKGNRELNEIKIKKIIADIEKGIDFLPYCPIIVNKAMEIIDGQHRFVVAKKLRTNVFYMIKEDASLEVVPALNSKGSKWRTVDFLNSYVDLKKASYVTLQNFLNTNPRVSLPVAIKLLHDGHMNAVDTIDVFREGGFEANYTDLTELIVGKLKDFETYASNPYGKRFVNAMLQLHDNGKYKHATMLEKLEQSGQRIENLESTKSIILNMEAIYNHRMKSRTFIA